MKKIVGFLFLSLGFTLTAQADVLPPAQADALCHAKALRAAHFLAESERPFIVSFTAAKTAEISTEITYEYRYVNSGTTEAIYTVVAYAYQDDNSCLIGSVTNNIAGND